MCSCEVPRTLGTRTERVISEQQVKAAIADLVGHRLIGELILPHHGVTGLCRSVFPSTTFSRNN